MLRPATTSLRASGLPFRLLAESLLLPAALALVLIGMVDLALGRLDATTLRLQAQFSTAHALMLLFAGSGLLAQRLSLPLLRVSSALALLTVTLGSALLRLSGDSDGGPDLSLVVAPLIAAALMRDGNEQRGRWVWSGVALLSMLTSLLCLSGLFPWLHPSHEPQHVWGTHALTLFLLATASLLLISSMAPRTGKLRIETGPTLVMLSGVLLSVSSWNLLIDQGLQEKQQRAHVLLGHIESVSRQALRSEIEMFVRMADRLDASGGNLDEQVMARDLQNYLLHNPSITAIAMLGPDLSLQALSARNESAAEQAHQQLTATTLQQWTQAAASDTIRLQAPASEQPELTWLLAPIPSANSQLLVSINLPQLMEDWLQPPLDVFEVRAQAWDRELLRLAAADGELNELKRSVYAEQRSTLPGELSLTLSALADRRLEPRDTLIASLVPSAGLVLTGILAYSLTLGGIAGRRSVALARSKNALGLQADTQQMMLDEAALHDILAKTCHLLTDRMPGSRCTIWINDLPDGQLRQATGLASAAGAIADSGSWCLPIRRGDGALLGALKVEQLQQAAPTPATINAAEKVAALAALAIDRHQSQRLLRTMQRSVEASVNGIIIVDACAEDMPVIYVNQAFSAITGYQEHEVSGQNCRFLQGVDTDPLAVEHIRQSLQTGREVCVTLLNYRKDGTAFWNSLNISPVRDNHGKVSHFVGIQHDISEQVEYQHQLKHNSRHDTLTQLPNRNLLEKRLPRLLTQAAQRHRRLSLLLIDLDDFKTINDTLGHDIGDLILCEVARRMQKLAQPQDLVARVSGDEFAWLTFAPVDSNDALQHARALSQCLSLPYQVAGSDMHITSSIGIARSQRENDSGNHLLQQAEMAMFQAKQRGRNSWQLHTAEISAKVERRLLLRNALQRALDQQQLALHYQPIFDADQRVICLEALLRWQHPQLGLISPAEFIPLAESTGQIIAIGQWITEQACRDMQTLTQAALAAVPVALNLSPVQFQDEDFVDKLLHTLQQHKMPAARFELELTEGILMEDAASAIAALHRLRAAGIGIAIDDFGTGYSSLSYLKHLPVNKIKIDRSFISELDADNRNAAIVQGIVAMAHHMKLQVVAEGVETQAQWQLLHEAGCDGFQGYLLARPMPVDELASLLQ